MSAVRYTGSCLCGGVQYSLSAEPGPIEVCYCRMCRKASGGPLATTPPVAAAAFRLTTGVELLSAYRSSRARDELSAPHAAHHSTVSSSPGPR
jgi:hypothetical protein